MSPPRFEAAAALLFLRTCGSQWPRRRAAASTAQFSADAPLRGDLQTHPGQPRRTHAAGTLARAHARTQVEACGCASLLAAFIWLQRGLCSSWLGWTSARVNSNVTRLFSCRVQAWWEAAAWLLSFQRERTEPTTPPSIQHLII